MISGLTHVALGVDDDPQPLLDFYGELFGVAEVARRGERIYLSGGTSSSFDIVLGPWGPGVDHFAFAVSDAASLSAAKEQLKGAGVTVEELEPGADPGIEEGIAFVLPSGHAMELVRESNPQVFRPTAAIDRRHHRGGGPVPLEHVTLNCGDVELVAGFLIDVLGFRLTESIRPDGRWFNAFMRCRSRHHDIAFFDGTAGAEDSPELNHLCFAVPSVEDIVRVSDLAAGMGITLDCSLGRHINGNNVFIYLKDPAGNRVEVNTDMADIDPAAPPRIGSEMRFDAWRESIPPAMLTASPCRDGRARVGG